MKDDAAISQDLRELNLAIGDKEGQGDRAFFRHLLHDRFVFRRASGDVDDKKWFLEKLQKGPARDTRISDVSLYGNRAIVTATVIMNVDGAAQSFHTLPSRRRRDVAALCLGERADRCLVQECSIVR